MQTCENCGSSDDLTGQELADGRRLVRCLACGHKWHRGEARPAATKLSSFDEARRRFPGPDNVDPERMKLVTALKEEFLLRRPEPDPDVGPYWARYQRVFSKDGLAVCDPQDLKDFANTDTGARPGNMSVFNTAWNEMGPEEASRRTRASIDYLLYGPNHVPLEDRLSDLIEDRHGLGMPGFKEALLTKVLCIVQPDRFIPILTYSSSRDGKKEIAQKIYGLNLPDAERVQWRIGRLILWSNDVLLTLAGDGFAHMQHVAQFFWETKDNPALSA